MLVLSRKPQERIHIGPEIVITVVGVRGQLVRLGITAPRAVKILRSELLHDDHAEHAAPAADARRLADA